VLQVFDDGSTLMTDAYGTVIATPATDIGDPRAYNPEASSWTDVLKHGFARVVDVYTARSLRPESRSGVPTYAWSPRYPVGAQGQAAAGSGLVWLLLAGVAVYALTRR
jgi:hypothetical protein